MNDFTRCKQDCNSCPCKEVVPDSCNGGCPSCERLRQCPCCNQKVREQFRHTDMDTVRRTELDGEPQEADIAISQISYPAPWQQRSLSNEFIRKMAKDLRERGQLAPIVVRPRARTNGTDRYQPVNGHARIRGAKHAGWISLRAFVKPMDDCEACVEYLLDNLAERKMPWEEVALGILVVEKALAKKTGHPCDSRRLGKVLGRSKDWVSDHKRALRIIREHEIPRGAISHHKLLRPLGHGLTFAVEETILQGIINEKWTFRRVREEVQKRCAPGAPSRADRQVGETSSGRSSIVARTAGGDVSPIVSSGSRAKLQEYGCPHDSPSG